jgi:hypothetical protein
VFGDAWESIADVKLAGAPAVLALVCYANALQGDFVFDDTYAITGNADVTSADGACWLTVLHRIFFLNDFWGQRIALPFSHKSYRPLTTLSFRLCHVVGHGRAKTQHSVNVGLHAAVSVLVFLLARRAGANSPSSLLAACWFAAHPVHVEAVTGLVGRADVLCTLFLLLASLSLRRAIAAGRERRWTAVCVCLLVFATLSKETGITGILPLSAYLLALSPRGALQRVGVLVGVGVAYVAWRRWLTEHVVLLHVRLIENPLSALAGWRFLLSNALVHLTYAR